MDTDEVACINEVDDTNDRALQVTLQEIEKLREKIKDSVPDSLLEFVMLLCRYANLLHAFIFGKRCLLLQYVVLIFKVLEAHLFKLVRLCQSLQKHKFSR